MKVLVVLSLAVVAALGDPTPGYLGATSYAAGLGIHAAPLTLPAASILTPSVSSQFHAQDELGQYHYGYSGGPSAKEEIRTADGSVAGAYSYVDAHGIVQSAHYVSDPVNGFRVAATNLPVGPAAPAPAVVATPAVAVAAAPAFVADAPEVVAARAAHFNAHLAAKAAVLGRKKRSPGFLSAAAPATVLSTPAATALAAPFAPVAYAAPLAYAAPAVAVAPAGSFAYSAVAAHGAQVVPAGPVAAYAAAAPVVAATPAAHVFAAAPAAVAYSAPAAAAVLPLTGSSQYRVQDELGQYTYGYADGNSVKTESRAADGSTVGGYSYVDGHGLVQSVKYHADALGFRVAGTNLPVGPA